eukprot:CAMPEP_0206601838 /NCGR_PEP_ID=MMETSP0325_2-20121206/46909_1 /ASSEMBLY_ACC=CAM_ASM_000347 /TAXON_ID=2866 /ORGANISM="Crypthecodinium cohnii, Strain Seligo" /LENGTH=655 /DNA_ID=CAMNT_0054113969 /DNA_START=20 /DNA_END=1984 /DNA_ORIENTATION=-
MVHHYASLVQAVVQPINGDEAIAPPATWDYSFGGSTSSSFSRPKHSWKAAEFSVSSTSPSSVARSGPVALLDINQSMGPAPTSSMKRTQDLTSFNGAAKKEGVPDAKAATESSTTAPADGVKTQQKPDVLKGQMAVDDVDMQKARFEAKQLAETYGREEESKAEINEARTNAAKQLARAEEGAAAAAELRAEEAVYREFGPSEEGNEVILGKEHAVRIEKESSNEQINSDERKDENRALLAEEQDEEKAIRVEEKNTQEAIQDRIFERNSVPGKIAINKWGERITSKASCDAEFGTTWHNEVCVAGGEEVSAESAEEVVAAEKVEEGKVAYQQALEQHENDPTNPALVTSLKAAINSLIQKLEDLKRFQSLQALNDKDDAALASKNSKKYEQLVETEVRKKESEDGIVSLLMGKLLGSPKMSEEEMTEERKEANFSNDEAKALSEGDNDKALWSHLEFLTAREHQQSAHDMRVREEASLGGGLTISTEPPLDEVTQNQANTEQHLYHNASEQEKEFSLDEDTEIKDMTEIEQHRNAKEREALSTGRMINELKHKLAHLDSLHLSSLDMAALSMLLIYQQKPRCIQAEAKIAIDVAELSLFTFSSWCEWSLVVGSMSTSLMEPRQNRISELKMTTSSIAQTFPLTWTQSPADSEPL